jgi:hypothetical protein
MIVHHFVKADSELADILRREKAEVTKREVLKGL